MGAVVVVWPTHRASGPHFGTEIKGTWKEAPKAAAMLCSTAWDVEMSCATPLAVVTWGCDTISRAGAACAEQSQSCHAEADFSCFVIQYFPLRFRARLGFKHIKAPVIVFFRFLSQIGRNLRIFIPLQFPSNQVKASKTLSSHVTAVTEWTEECQNQGFS